MTQTTNHILMVRPARFAFNEETAVNNAFQQRGEGDIAQQAVAEFDAFVALLRANGIVVDVLQDTALPFTPDSIFPNNCFSTHGSTLVLYPMFAHNRRLEREKLMVQLDGMHFSEVIDLTAYEADRRFLEGTGSLVLDREHRMAYACLSPRTDEDVLREWASRLGYCYLTFRSEDEQGTPVYHTNVVMHIGTHHAVVCLESVSDAAQRARLRASLEANGKQVVPITLEQMHHFAGNMLELTGSDGEQLLVMSATARASLTPAQVSELETATRIVSPDIHTIETAGGGSARCMMAELFD